MPPDPKCSAKREERRAEKTGVGWRTGANARVSISLSSGQGVRVTWRGETIVPSRENYVGGARSSLLRFQQGDLLGGEHLFAALAGLGVYSNLDLEVEGVELPLLDGCCREWAEAIAGFALPQQEPSLCVVRSACIDVDGSEYFFEPAEGVVVTVELIGMPRHVVSTYAWDGGRESFLRSVAPARTFVLEDEIAALVAGGMAAQVDPGSVFVVARDRLVGSNPVESDEPARHKLLDLLGDWYAFGGPPAGSVRARKPGHGRNVRAMGIALDRGIVSTCAPSDARTASRPGT